MQTLSQDICIRCGHSKSDHANGHSMRTFDFCEHPDCECQAFFNSESYIKDLLDFGFKEFKINSQLDRHDKHFQFKSFDGDGIRFFINVRFWQNSKYSTDDRPVPDGFDAHAQFTTYPSHIFDINLISVTEMKPDEIVKWFSRVFDDLECLYYKVWDN